MLHDEDLAHAIVDRILERGRLLTLDGPSLRTKHLGLDDPTSSEALHQPARISGIDAPEFPEPTRGKTEHMKSRSPQQNKSAPTESFIRADREEDLGNLRSAFRLFLAAAKAGDVNAQSRVGYCYDVGQGVRSDRSAL